MKKLFAAIALFVAGCVPTSPVWAGEFQMVFEGDNGFTLRLYATPCMSPEILKVIPAAVRVGHDFYAGSETYQGRDVKLCWADLDDETVLLVDGDGDVGAAPKKVFKPANVI